MRESIKFTISFLLMSMISPLAVVAQSGSLVSQMSDLAWAEEIDQAQALLEGQRVNSEQPTPEWLAAVSWMARGASFAERWDLAEQYASEAYEGSLELMKERPLDAERFLPTALGAGIEVLGRTYDAEEAFQMGMVNKVVAHNDLEVEALEWAAEINSKSPTAIRMLKFAFNLIDDGLVGQQLFAGEATRLAYSTDEASEGREAFLEKRDRDFSSFPYHY